MYDSAYDFQFKNKTELFITDLSYRELLSVIRLLIFKKRESNIDPSLTIQYEGINNFLSA